MLRRHRRDRPARRLRVSIDALPRATKLAMLEGLRETAIIVGAYSTREGTCPMLAAHRRGGRTSLATFARAWDGYTPASDPRPATERELRALESMLEASLAAEEGGTATELARAVDEHRAARARRAAQSSAPERGADARPGDPDRSHELRRRPGWAWLRVFRRLDEFEAAVASAEGGKGAAERFEPGADAERPDRAGRVERLAIAGR